MLHGARRITRNLALDTAVPASEHSLREPTRHNKADGPGNSPFQDMSAPMGDAGTFYRLADCFRISRIRR